MPQCTCCFSVGADCVAASSNRLLSEKLTVLQPSFDAAESSEMIPINPNAQASNYITYHCIFYYRYANAASHTPAKSTRFRRENLTRVQPSSAPLLLDSMMHVNTECDLLDSRFMLVSPIRRFSVPLRITFKASSTAQQQQVVSDKFPHPQD